MSYAIDAARAAVADMEKAIESHPDDGLVYEDSYVVVERVDGKIVMTGKPMRFPFCFEEAP